MTDRFKGVVVTFEEDIREDDAEKLLNAIWMLKGVIDVTPSVANVDDHLARERVRRELGRALMEVVYPEIKGGA